MYLGLGMFELKHGVSIEQALGDEYMNLLENRWHDYDLVIATKTEPGIPALDVAAELSQHLDTKDPTITYQLSIDFLLQLETMKRTAFELGIIK
jgi:hypothetical protein